MKPPGGQRMMKTLILGNPRMVMPVEQACFLPMMMMLLLLGVVENHQQTLNVSHVGWLNWLYQ